MKNIIKIIMLVLLISVMMIIPKVKAEEKINVYLFWGDGCPHCEKAKEFFSNMDISIKQKFNLIKYEVWYNKTNSELMNKVSNKIGVQTDGVPLIVIGKKHFEGYSDKFDKNIIDSITQAYSLNDSIDIVKPLISKEKKEVNIFPQLIIGTLSLILLLILAITLITKQKKSK